MLDAIPATPAKTETITMHRVRCFRRADGQTIEGCDRIRFRSHGTCEMVYRDDTFEVLPMSIHEAEQAVRRGIWVEVPDTRAANIGAPPHLANEWRRLREAENEAAKWIVGFLENGIVASPDAIKSWRQRRADLATFEATHGIGGGVTYFKEPLQ